MDGQNSQEGTSHIKQPGPGGLHGHEIPLAHPEISSALAWGKPFCLWKKHQQELVGVPVAINKPSRPKQHVKGSINYTAFGNTAHNRPGLNRLNTTG